MRRSIESGSAAPVEVADDTLTEAAAFVGRLARAASPPLAVLGRVALASGVAVGLLAAAVLADRTEGVTRLWSAIALLPLVPGLLTCRYARRLAAVGADPAGVRAVLVRFGATARELSELWRELLAPDEAGSRARLRVLWTAWRAVKLAAAKGSEVSQRSWEVQEAVGVPRPVTLWAGLAASVVLIVASPLVAVIALASVAL